MGNKKFDWTKYPNIVAQAYAQDWLSYQLPRLSINSVKAYANSLEDFFRFCGERDIDPMCAKTPDIFLYIRNLSERPLSNRLKPRHQRTTEGYALSTQKQRITAIRLFYDFLIEEEVRPTNPITRGKYVQGSYTKGQRGIIPTLKELPWIPTQAEWEAILKEACHCSIRLQFMLLLSYDTGLRREELCRLEARDVDPSKKTIHIRAETTKGKHGRIVIYSEATDILFQEYLNHRRSITRDAGRLFVSESPRNFGKPISHETWSKEIRQLRNKAGVPGFTPHTLRHLCLTDLARSGWDLHEIASFAGHRSIQSSLLYIHLSARDLIEIFKNHKDQMHDQRITEIVNTFAESKA